MIFLNNNFIEIQSKRRQLTGKIHLSERLQISLWLILILSFSSSCRLSATAENNTAGQADARKTRNETAILRARENIEKSRKGDAQIKVLDSKGKSIGQTQIKITQISHDFKFGCYLKIDDLAPEKLPEYEKHFARLFNYAALGTYWDFVENKRGIEDWSWFERETAFAEKLNLKIQAAPILWGTNAAGTPSWLPTNKTELSKVLENRVKSSLTKNKNTVGDWEIVNEPLAPKTDFFAAVVGADYIETTFLQARQTAPEKRLLINEYGVFGADKKHNYNRDKYLELLKKMTAKNVPFDVIGIQAHGGGEWFEPANVAEQLGRYAALGKPLQITEFSAQTLEYDDRKTPLEISGAYRSGVWNADKQAEFYREFYTVAFGVPQIEAITTWGLDDERAWLPGIGLIDENGDVKPNYKILDRLINDEWRTNLQLKTAAGIARFRGFYGVYEVEISVNGKRAKAKFELRKNDKNEWILHI